METIALSATTKLLAGAPAPGASPFEVLGSFIPLVLMFVIFYFLLIRPQQKRQRDLKAIIDNLKKGDKVITTGGLYGTIVGLGDNYVHLKIADQIKVKVSRSAIGGLQGEGDEKGNDE